MLAIHLAVALALAATATLPVWAAAPVVRVGLQADGTLSWVVFLIERFALDRAHGFTLEATAYASKDAARIALRGGDVDVVVDDFVGAALMRENRIPVRAVYPFSLATGGVVVPAASPVENIADLRGRRVGVASLADKSWLILRALAVSRYDFDPQVESEALAAAPPLMAALLERGELDAAVPYWHFVARLAGTGAYRELISVTEMLAALGLPHDLPILVVVATEGAIAEKPAAIAAFLAAMRDAWDHLAGDPTLMDAIVDAGLYSLPDRSLLPEVWQRWHDGVPARWTQETVQGLVDLVEALVAVAGSEVVGLAAMDPGTFTTALNPD